MLIFTKVAKFRQIWSPCLFKISGFTLVKVFVVAVANVVLVPGAVEVIVGELCGDGSEIRSEVDPVDAGESELAAHDLGLEHGVRRPFFFKLLSIFS